MSTLLGTPPKLPRRGRRPCAADGCEGWSVARNLCGRHLQRLYKHGDVTVTLIKREHDNRCSVDGCGRSYYGNGFCRLHNDRFRAHGSSTLADDLIERQRGLCAICGRPPSGRGHESRLHLDHDHTAGYQRGMLCGPCNKALGLLEDDIERMHAAIAYLHGWKKVAA